MLWRLYYDDGSTFSDEDGPWEEAPPDGVLFAVQWQDGKKEVLSGSDFYFFHDGSFGQTNDLGPLLRKLGIIKFGRWTTHAKLERAAAMVRADDGS